MQVNDRPLVYRQDRMFKINKDKLPSKYQTMEVTQKLYIAIFREFQGASVNEKYKNMSYQQRIEQLNVFAVDWLDKQGYK